MRANFLFELLLWRIMALGFAAELLWLASVKIANEQIVIMLFFGVFTISYLANAKMLKWLTILDPSRELIRYYLPVLIPLDIASVVIGCAVGQQKMYNI